MNCARLGQRHVELVGLLLAGGVRELELGVRRERRLQVAGRVELGHDRHVVAARDAHELAHVGLRQVRVADDLRVRLALDPEALVVGEVEVEQVELQAGRAP